MPRPQPSMRMCIACRRVFDKRDLLRVVRTPEGEFVLDRTGKKAGRGAYLCTDPECVRLTVKNKLLNKSFKTAIPEEAYRRFQEDYESK